MIGRTGAGQRVHRRVLKKQPACGEYKYFMTSTATTRLAMPTSDVLVSCCNRHHASSEQRLNQPGVHQWGVRARPRPVSGSILQQYATEDLLPSSAVQLWCSARSHQGSVRSVWGPERFNFMLQGGLQRTARV